MVQGRLRPARQRLGWEGSRRSGRCTARGAVVEAMLDCRGERLPRACTASDMQGRGQSRDGSRGRLLQVPTNALASFPFLLQWHRPQSAGLAHLQPLRQFNPQHGCDLAIGQAQSHRPARLHPQLAHPVGDPQQEARVA